MINSEDNCSKSGRKQARRPIKAVNRKTRNNLMNYTKLLASLGVLQQTIVINIQKEIENME